MTSKQNVLLVRLFVALTLSALCSTSHAFAQTLRSTMPLQSFSANADRGGIIINQTTNRIYVLGTTSNSVRAINVIDGTDGSSLALIPLPGGHNNATGNDYAMAINTQTNRIYVLDGLDDFVGTVVRVIDGNTNTIMTTIPFFFYSQYSRGPVVDSISNRIYVEIDGDGIYVIDGNTNSVLTHIQTQARPAAIGPRYWGSGGGYAWIGMAVNPNTHRVYMPLQDDSSLMVIDGTNNTFITVPLDFLPDGEIVVNPATNRIYLSGEDSAYSYVGVIDGATNNLVAKL